MVKRCLGGGRPRSGARSALTCVAVMSTGRLPRRVLDIVLRAAGVWEFIEGDQRQVVAAAPATTMQRRPRVLPLQALKQQAGAHQRKQHCNHGLVKQLSIHL